MSTILEEQAAFIPEVVGSSVRPAAVVCGGMGGSALPVLLARFLGASAYLALHREYELPLREIPGAHYIALSHSGNTEETLSFARAVVGRGLPLSVVTSGGALLEFAQEKNLSYVQVPTGTQPRDSVLAMTKALLALLGEEGLVKELSAAFSRSTDAEGEGHSLAHALEGATPVFYSSTRNEALAYIAKIQCNETAKVPAFFNVFPELNHNEMQGWGVGGSLTELTKQFVAVFLRDESDSARVVRRMEHTEHLLREQGIRTATMTLSGMSRAHTALYGWWCARTCARALAEHYGADPDAVPLIETFKKTL